MTNNKRIQTTSKTRKLTVGTMFSISAIAALMLVSSSGLAHASLIDDEVTIGLSSSGIVSDVDPSTPTVAEEGDNSYESDFSLCGVGSAGTTIDIDESTILLTYSTNLFCNQEEHTLTFSDLDWGDDIGFIANVDVIHDLGVVPTVEHTADSITLTVPEFQQDNETNEILLTIETVHTFEGGKTWTHTDYNWDPICDDNLDGLPDDPCETPLRDRNINNEFDNVLAETLDPDEDGTSDVQVQVKKGKIKNMNPGATFALTTVVMTSSLSMLEVQENYEDCTADGPLELLNQKKLSRNLKAAVANPDGDVTEVTDRLYDEFDDGVQLLTVSETSATVKINDENLLAEGSTAYVLVKFDDTLRNEPYVAPFSCENTEVVTSTISDVSVDHTFEATLQFTEKS